MTRPFSRIGLFSALVLVATVACGKKKPEVQATPNTTPTSGAPSPTCPQSCMDSIARLAKAREDSIAAANAAAAKAAALASTKAKLMERILFEYDATDLTPEARAILDAKIPILRANTGVRVRITGHADERGSDEYNLALGQRRALATKRYLTDRGIDGGRIDIHSVGEERPIATDGTEASFRQNRRAEFEIVAGESTMVPVT